MTDSLENKPAINNINSKDKRSNWGARLFTGTFLLILVFFWWLLIYSGGAVGPHGQ